MFIASKNVSFSSTARVDRTVEARRRRQCHHDCLAQSTSVVSSNRDRHHNPLLVPHIKPKTQPQPQKHSNMPFVPILAHKGRFRSSCPPSSQQTNNSTSSSSSSVSSMAPCMPRRQISDPPTKPRHFSLGQTLLVGLGCASFAAVSTAFLAVCCLGDNLMQHSNELSSSSTTVGSALSGMDAWTRDAPTLARMMTTVAASENNATDSSSGHYKSAQPDNEYSGPKVAWLMSFPNSGTSFTIHMTREATNSTTATNYALEGEIKDEPSVQAIPGKRGRNGPFLELIPNRTTTIPNNLILTKTHCKGFCNGRNCGPDKTVHTVRSFMTGCRHGKRAVATEDGIIKPTPVTYDASLVKKAIHIMRHPLDNIVARFHLEYNVQTHIKGNKDYAKVFPKNQQGFRRWCAADDANQHILRSHFLAYDHALKEKMAGIPCMNDFFRYVQWHNLAFSTSADLDLPTMVLHYHEYSEDFPKARDRVLDWLELERVGEGIEFHSGKVYRHYYTNEQKIAIRDFLQEFSSAPTWEQLKDYDFEIQDGNSGHSASTE